MRDRWSGRGFLRLLVGLAFCAGPLACGGGGGSTPDPPPPGPTGPGDQRALEAKAGGPYYADCFRPFTFSGLGSTTPNPPITRYSWTFGDGTSGSGPTPQHTYTPSDRAARTYTVRLEVEDASGARDADETTCRVRCTY